MPAFRLSAAKLIAIQIAFRCYLFANKDNQTIVRFYPYRRNQYKCLREPYHWQQS